MLPGYWQQTLGLGPDPDGEGDLVATLVRRGEPDRTATHAVLLVHGYTDYFFNTELADHFAARGFAFYALDLHKCGRSWREGQTPHFTTDLARYDTELERALRPHRRRRPVSADVLMYGHSAGGLIVPLWLDRVRQARRHREASHHRPGAQQPVAGSAGPGDPARRADVGGADRRDLALAQEAGGRARRPRAATAPRCTATTAATSTTTWSGSRSAASPSPSAGCNAIRRGTGQAAPRTRRRRAQPDPAVGPQCARR